MNCTVCKKVTVVPFSNSQPFRVCVCLEGHYQCLDCDEERKFICGQCGSMTFPIHVRAELDRSEFKGSSSDSSLVESVQPVNNNNITTVSSSSSSRVGLNDSEDPQPESLDVAKNPSDSRREHSSSSDVTKANEEVPVKCQEDKPLETLHKSPDSVNEIIAETAQDLPEIATSFNNNLRSTNEKQKADLNAILDKYIYKKDHQESLDVAKNPSDSPRGQSSSLDVTKANEEVPQKSQEDKAMETLHKSPDSVNEIIADTAQDLPEIATSFNNNLKSAYEKQKADLNAILDYYIYKTLHKSPDSVNEIIAETAQDLPEIATSLNNKLKSTNEKQKADLNAIYDSYIYNTDHREPSGPSYTEKNRYPTIYVKTRYPKVRDIRSCTERERLLQIQGVNSGLVSLKPQQKYLYFSCQLLPKHQSLGWPTSEAKKELANDISQVRRVRYNCSNSDASPCELVECPEVFLKNRSKRVNLPISFESLKEVNVLFTCPEPHCQQCLNGFHINCHFTCDHLLSIVAQLELNRSMILDLNLADVSKGAKVLALMQLKRVVSGYTMMVGDLLPVCIMRMHVKLSELLGNCDRDERLTLVWAATITSKSLPLKVSLTLWPSFGDGSGSMVSYTGSPYPIQESTRPSELIRSGTVIILSAEQVNSLTENGKCFVNAKFVGMLGPLKEDISG
ncbi:uncharacterized protein LOC119556558 [Drosophila subpulchrella]|uniref:uncharacterized protein LOC119556558 n=1 Tax=Drosophila subpulchrella TaxID=1486046 RepID=UPI0018A12886|nr:uncharacterized protein LOC119556558 [Drosophila subpulchrella]XP_037724779.1 uncharacterized protein LOC119556558 [Drosophila subpulchrella]XP_037724780.1 uncharacterized protein LOC119556558 [Drosophila subpulchrella]